MSQTWHAPPLAALTPYQLGWRRFDAVLAVVMVIWMAEALVRFGNGTALTALVYGALALRFAMTAQRLLPAVMRSLPLMLYPLVCLLSVLWSTAPEVSLVAGIQILVTILAGVYLGLGLSLHRLAGLLALALGLTMVASLFNLDGSLGPAYSWEGGFLGIYTNKNALGQRGALLLLCCTYLALAPGRPAARWSAVALGGLMIVLLVLSRSATSILLAVPVCGGLAVWSLAARRGLRPWIVVAAATGAALGLTLLVGLGANPVSAVLGAFDKNTTLTGRTVLWQLGMDRIAEKPVLGNGAMAYWATEAYAHEVAVMRRLYGTTVAAFHNFVIEILVMTGPLGLLAMLALLGTTLHRILNAPPGLERGWALAALGLVVALSLLGSSLYRAHEISLLVVVALGASAARRQLLAPVRPAVR